MTPNTYQFILLIGYYSIICDFAHYTKKVKKYFESKWKIIKLLCFAIRQLCAILLYVIMFLVTFAGVFALDAKQKTNYVTVQKNSHEKVVLFQSNDKLFVADFLTIEDETTFYTKKYQIIDIDDVEFTNVEFKSVTINKNEEKPK